MTKLPLILMAAGIGAGVGLGMMLQPAPEPAEAPPGGEAAHGGDGAGTHTAAAEPHAELEPLADPDEPRDYVEIGRQMIVPVVEGGETRALMMFELAVDVPASMRDTIFGHQPKLRDAFLRDLLEMSYTGAFLGTFTDDAIIEEMRRKLLRSAQDLMGPDVRDVLILDIMRQEMD